jgi:hypothetical protein
MKNMFVFLHYTKVVRTKFVVTFISLALVYSVRESSILCCYFVITV